MQKQRQARPAQTQQHARAANARKRRKKRASSYALYYILLTMVLLAAGIALSLTVFFNIDAIEVKGYDQEPKEKIVNVSGILLGENLFRVDKAKAQQNLQDTFPEIKSVKVYTKLPNTMVIEIEPEQPIGAILEDENQELYTILAESGKILEMGAQEYPEGVALIRGFSMPEDAKAGTYLEEEKSESLVMLRYLMQAVKETGFSNISYVDLSDRLNLRLIYDERIVIDLGSEADLEYKLTFFRKIIDEQLSADFEGLLDATISKEIRKREISIDKLLEQEKNESGSQSGESSPEQPPANNEGESGSSGQSGASGATGSSQSGQSGSGSSSGSSGQS